MQIKKIVYEAMDSQDRVQAVRKQSNCITNIQINFTESDGEKW